jgi:glyoxylase-like metal-dependent hydrolase (beta-lactamase superfamily II)
MSHLHCDHASGLPLVREAKKILVSEDEWRSANRLPMVYLPREWRGIDVVPYAFSQTSVGPFGRLTEVSSKSGRQVTPRGWLLLWYAAEMGAMSYWLRILDMQNVRGKK